MDFSDEKKKPLYVIREPRPRAPFVRLKIATLLSEGMLQEAGGGYHMMKAAAFDSMPELLEEAVAEDQVGLEKKLIIERFKAVPDKLYRFLDGQEFNGNQAAEEVERGTERGRYFFELEKDVLEFAREAKKRGEF